MGGRGIMLGLRHHDIGKTVRAAVLTARNVLCQQSRVIDVKAAGQDFLFILHAVVIRARFLRDLCLVTSSNFFVTTRVGHHILLSLESSPVADAIAQSGFGVIQIWQAETRNRKA
jgi:hypothetical protein